MDNENSKQLDIQEGTIEILVKENKLIWNDNKSTILFNIPVNKTGSLFMVKDGDNKLKFFHVILEKGRTDVETDVSKLPTEKPHHIVATWSVTKKEVCLYIDGELKTKTEIKYSF
jgi:hypothetical protein